MSGNTNSPWFPDVLKKGSHTSSPWFGKVYGLPDKVVKKSVGKIRVRGGKNDLDGDGVPNWKDCQPKNTMRQDKVMTIAKKSMGNFFNNLEKNTPQEPVPPEKPTTKEGPRVVI